MKHKKIISGVAALVMLQSSALADVNYTSQKGDSYWLVSKKFNISMETLLKENNAGTSSPLMAGQIIKVPSDTYTVQKGDTFYLIAKRCNLSLSELLKLNNATSSTVLYEGRKLKLPSTASGYTTYTVQKGDTYWIISQKYGISLDALLKANNAVGNPYLEIGDSIIIPKNSQSSGSGNTSGSGSSASPTISYKTYTVKSGDTFWNIAIAHGIPYAELLEVNSLTSSSKIYVGMKLTIPVHNIPVKYAPAGYGELLDWFKEAQYVIPINADFKIVDLATGKSFNARRTVGSGHADCEPLTAQDTAIMKEIWGGTLNWNKRSVLVKTKSRTIAASMSGMLHAGNENAPGGQWTDWRSDNYGAGENYDYVKGNNAHGHFDLYFYNSIGHSSPTTNATHQKNILRSAGQ